MTSWDTPDADIKQDIQRTVNTSNVIYGPATLLTYIPPPKRGGTFLYCEHTVEREVPKIDKLGRKTRYTEKKQVPCEKRFRKWRKYHQHFRRAH